MDESLKTRIGNQIFKFEASLENSGDKDSSFTLDFERGRYRQKELVGLIRDVVPFFALTQDELEQLDLSEVNSTSFTRISDARKQSKGDYGELMLYIILSFFSNAPKFVTKARLRSTPKEQIKGFDCAHFSIEEDDGVVLWLGEAKFHKSFSGAVSSSLKSLKEHLTDSEKIKSELKLLGGEIEINKTLEKDKYNLLKSYVDGGRSLDKTPINVPVLLTYDSPCIKAFCEKLDADIESDEFLNSLSTELNSKFKTIYEKDWPSEQNIRIIFYLVPFESVAQIKEQIEQVENAMRF